jgi:hypothetical protein
MLPPRLLRDKRSSFILIFYKLNGNPPLLLLLDYYIGFEKLNLG